MSPISMDAWFRALSEAAPAGVAMMSPDGAVTYLNDAALRMLSLPLDRALGQGWLDGLHPDDRERVRTEWATAAAARRPYAAAGRFSRADFWWRLRTAPVWSEKTCVGHVAVIADETEQRSADDAVREGEERFRQLAEHIPAVVYLVDPRIGSVLYISPAYEEIWGRTIGSLYSSPWSFLDAVHEDDRARVEHAYRRRLNRLSIEYRIVRADGMVAWIEDVRFPIRRADGKVYLIAGLAFDVTRRKQLELQLLEAQKMDSLRRLAGGVAHDFNNLLTVIFSHTDGLRESAGGGPALERGLNEIDKAAERAAALNRQLLTLAQRQAVTPQVLDLNRTVADLEPQVRQMLSDRIALVVRADAPRGTVRADAGQIGQVVLNLVGNARDAMPGGGTLRVETGTAIGPVPGTAVPAGQYVALTVADTGAGIPAELRSRVFEPFFSTKAGGHGTGLGLSVAYSIIRQFNGYVELSSSAGGGTEVTCYLPVVNAT